jgi:hypothetical protein
MIGRMAVATANEQELNYEQPRGDRIGSGDARTMAARLAAAIVAGPHLIQGNPKSPARNNLPAAWGLLTIRW